MRSDLKFHSDRVMCNFSGVQSRLTLFLFHTIRLLEASIKPGVWFEKDKVEFKYEICSASAQVSVILDLTDFMIDDLQILEAKPMP